MNYPHRRVQAPGAYYLSPHYKMGNSASSQPVQSNVQGLIIGESDMTTLNLHNKDILAAHTCEITMNIIKPENGH